MIYINIKLAEVNEKKGGGGRERKQYENNKSVERQNVDGGQSVNDREGTSASLLISKEEKRQ